MPKPRRTDEAYLGQLRLLLEELVCDLCRFAHVKDGWAPDAPRIEREYRLDSPDSFADIRVGLPQAPAYFIEVKWGYSDEAVRQSLRRKYSRPGPALSGAAKVVLVIDKQGRTRWKNLAGQLAKLLAPKLRLEIWDETTIERELAKYLKVKIQDITEDDLLDVRQAIDRAKGFHAFGGESRDAYAHQPLNAELLWHFSYWRLRQLREPRQLAPREILPPGTYRGVAVLLADLCSFSSFVRDTQDTDVIRENLTSFYSKARYQIINRGGMLDQFVGDQVIGFFGIPERGEGDARTALETAQALLSIGDSVSNEWQRRLDRVQTSGGIHVGMALGDIEMVSLRPFSRTHMGAIGDCVNVAARLMNQAGSGEIAVSNAFYHELDDAARAEFKEIEPVEARNVGRIKAWHRARMTKR